MTLDPETQRTIAERVRFYRELGIHDFYRRQTAPSAVEHGLSGGAMSEAASATATIDTDAGQEAGASMNARVADGRRGATAPLVQISPEAALAAIFDDIGDCTRCVLHKGRNKLVFGVGDPHAQLMFVGEGPGADEDAQGIPFVGRAGQLLTNMIKAMGLEREQVYIANVVKCRPPGNRTPERDECDTCGPFLMRQIVAIRPKVMVALGATAAKYLLGLNDSMGNLRGRWYDFAPQGAPPGMEPVKLAVTYHPAYLLRDPRQKGEAWKDLQMVMKHMGLRPPAKS